MGRNRLILTILKSTRNNFYIENVLSVNYFSSVNQEEIKIDTISTTQKKFSQCSNSKCRSLYLFESAEKSFEDNFLCPNCREKLLTHHLVQCKNCQSLVNFIRVDEGEEPIVFYVNKCHHCSGSFEDERRIQPFYNPELFI